MVWLLALLLLSIPAHAQDSGGKTLSGKVTAVDDQDEIVTVRDGKKKWTFGFNEKSVITKGDDRKEIEVPDIHVGDKVEFVLARKDLVRSFHILIEAKRASPRVAAPLRSVNDGPPPPSPFFPPSGGPPPGGEEEE